jgi:hypothetical protein
MYFTTFLFARFCFVLLNKHKVRTAYFPVPTAKRNGEYFSVYTYRPPNEATLLQTLMGCN